MNGAFACSNVNVSSSFQTKTMLLQLLVRVCGFHVIFSAANIHSIAWLRHRTSIHSFGLSIFFPYNNNNNNFNNISVQFCGFPLLRWDITPSKIHKTCARRSLATELSMRCEKSEKELQSDGIDVEFFLLFTLVYYLWWFLWFCSIRRCRYFFRSRLIKLRCG